MTTCHDQAGEGPLPLPIVTTVDRVRAGDQISMGGVMLTVVDMRALATRRRRIQFVGSSHVVLDDAQVITVLRKD